MTIILKTKIQNLFILFLVIFLCALFLPFNLIIAERREFVLKDRNGAPIEDAQISQRWHQYSLKFVEQEVFKPDPNGLVIIPERKVKTRGKDLIIGALSNLFKYRLHASIGSSDSIVINANGFDWVSFRDGKGLESKIVVLN